MSIPTKHALLSDGTTIRIRVQRDLIGTYLHEVPSRKRPAGSLLWMDGAMYLVARRQLVKITHPEYAYADTRASAARMALAFFVDSAEATIKHAAEEGVSVDQCY